MQMNVDRDLQHCADAIVKLEVSETGLEKTRFFFKTQPSGFFLFFFGVFWVYVFFIYI
jgi:hypothetical protein